MKALITGGTGFVGSHVARALVEAGHSVRVLHRATSKLDALADVPFESALGDILDAEALRAACAGCDWVFHVAAVAAYWRTDVVQMLEANVEGTRRVLAAAKSAGVGRVVFTSSAAAVGFRADGSPADETQQFALPSHRFPYGYSKFLAERVAARAVEGGQDVVIVNPVVVLGPGDLNTISGGFVIEVKQKSPLIPVTSGGVAVVDVRDVARLHLAAAERGRSGERYILGAANFKYADWYALIARVVEVPPPSLMLPDAVLPVIALAADVARGLGVPLPIDANQVRLAAQNIFFDFSKAWRELGTPQIDMEQSLRDTYEWYRANGYL
jgi:dihydroflavonol-4-reductase